MEGNEGDQGEIGPPGPPGEIGNKKPVRIFYISYSLYIYISSNEVNNMKLSAWVKNTIETFSIGGWCMIAYRVWFDLGHI